MELKTIGYNSILAIVSMLLLQPSVNANNLSTTNTSALVPFWKAAEATNRPVTVLSFGDSMADSYRSVTFHLMNMLGDRLGFAGYAMMNYQNRTLWTPSGGAAEIPPGPLWYAQHFELPTGSSIYWWNQLNSGGIPADKAGVFYVAQPEGGQFRLSISTNGGPWITKLLLDGYNPTPVGRYTNIFLKPDNYRIRLDCEFGTNYIIGTQHCLSQTNGVVIAFTDFSGIHLGQVTNVPMAIRVPIMAALNPDLIVWHMKEDSSLATSNRLDECEMWWKESVPSASVIYIGTPWMDLDLSSAWTPNQNTVVRNIALKHRRAYADLMQPTISYSWLSSNNFIPDGTHLSSAGALYCANIMWDDMGFFSLGLNKKLSLTKTGTNINLSYNTDSRAVYRLESSTNLQTWTPILTNAPVTATFTTNFIPPATATYYRLGLRPN
jgi:hypothetical protein